MYRFLLRPRWLLFSAVVIALMVLMVNLGLWQLSRLHERQDLNRTVSSRQDLPPAPIDAVLAADDAADAARAVEWTPVEIDGRFDPAHQVLVRNRSFDGQPGYHVLTPLVRADGTAVIVNRGWVPISNQRDVGPDVPAAPAGDVTVVGRLRPTQERGRLGPRDPAAGDLTELARADLARLQQQVPYDLWPAYVGLIQPAPANRGFPLVIPPPELDEGSHLSYTIQWFTFSVLALVGWATLARRRARELARPAPQDAVGPSPSEPPVASHP